MKIKVYDSHGYQVLVMDTASLGEAHVRIEQDDVVVRVREVDNRLLYSTENAYADEALVHVLWGGASLCQMPGVPSTWPSSHRWVLLSDEALTNIVTCPRCSEQRDELLPKLKAIMTASGIPWRD